MTTFSYKYETLQSYQVLQRDQEDTARVELENGEIVQLKAGGPYTIGDRHDILVGDIWILAGQSNMEGVGDLVDVEEPSPFVHSFQSKEEWTVAEEPLHWLSETRHVVHYNLWGEDALPEQIPTRDPNRTKGAGLGLTFAKDRYEQTGIPVGLIPSAHGGTSMEQWDPTLREKGSASLYGALLKRIERIGGHVTGVLWYQGESNAYPEAIEIYPRQMDALLHALRTDLQQPELPFYLVQLGRFVHSDANKAAWSGIREAQRTWAQNKANVELVSAVDLDLDDFIHIGTPGLKRLGHRLANVAAGKPAPSLVGVEYQAEQFRIVVSFEHVQGQLQAGGLPHGFSLHDGQRSEVITIYKTTLQGNSAILHLHTDPLPPNTVLFYGWGATTYANIVDANDAAIPAFGPWPIN